MNYSKSMFDGGIFLDGRDRKKLGKHVVEVSESQKKKISKADSDDILFGNSEELDEITPAVRPKKDKSERVQKESRSRATVEIPQDLLDEFGDYQSTFDPSTATKKQFRSYRKLLAEIANVKYPKKRKEKKEKKSKKSKK